MRYEIKKQLLFWLSVTFFFMTIVGTLSHEWGHYITAKWLGYDAVISFNYTWLPDEGTGLSERESFLITLGGPLQTMITGTLGLVLLFIQRRDFSGHKQLSFGQWVLIFMCLFWTRQTVNLIAALIGFIFTNEWNGANDEVKLATHFQLPAWTLAVTSGMMGVAVFAVLLFRFIPQRLRLTFLLAGGIGGITGYVIWVRLL